MTAVMKKLEIEEKLGIIITMPQICYFCGEPIIKLVEGVCDYRLICSCCHCHYWPALIEEKQFDIYKEWSTGIMFGYRLKCRDCDFESETYGSIDATIEGWNMLNKQTLKMRR